VRVLEISQGVAAGYAGLLLAQQGFSVERFCVAEMDANQDAFLHRNKTDLHQLSSLSDIEGFDVIIEDVGLRRLQSLNLSYRKIRKNFKHISIISLSSFGLTGPYKDWESTDLIVQAAAGLMHCIGYDEEAPLKLPGDAAHMILGIHGATAALAAAVGCAHGEEAQHVDISAQDTLMQHWTRHVSQFAYSGTRLWRGKRDPEGIHARHTAMAADGWVYLLALRVPWQDVAAFIGLDTHLHFDDDRDQPWDEMASDFFDALAEKTKYQWFAEAAEMGWTFAPVEDTFDLQTNPQSLARGAFESVAVDGEQLLMPVLPFRWED